MGNSALKRQETLVKKGTMKQGKELEEWATASEHNNMESLESSLRNAGLESSNLIVAVDFTKSNRTQGRKSFDGQCLHNVVKAGNSNPYEAVLRICGDALSPFDDDNQIPALYFGDAETRHTACKPFGKYGPCQGMDNVLDEYRKLASTLDFSGPTSFAPVIDKAVEIVKAAGNTFHILVIVADGQVSNVSDCLSKTRSALVRASHHPLAVVIVGVGDGPFEEMDALDDLLPERVFDNCQFVNWAVFDDAIKKGESPDVVQAAFAVCALQEVPQQYRTVLNLGLLKGDRSRNRPAAIEATPPAKRARTEHPA